MSDTNLSYPRVTDPILTRHEDDTVTIDWCTADGGMPNGWLKVATGVLAGQVEEHNRLVRELAWARGLLAASGLFS